MLKVEAEDLVGNEGTCKLKLFRECEHLWAKDRKVILDAVAGNVHEILGQRHASAALLVFLFVQALACLGRGECE